MEAIGFLVGTFFRGADECDNGFSRGSFFDFWTGSDGFSETNEFILPLGFWFTGFERKASNLDCFVIPLLSVGCLKLNFFMLSSRTISWLDGFLRQN